MTPLFSFQNIPQIKITNKQKILEPELRFLLGQYQPEYIRITDPYKYGYDLGTYQQLADILKVIVAARPWIQDVDDCDKHSIAENADASQILMLPAFGTVDVILPDTSRHSLNFFINDTMQLFYLEPQTGQIFPFNSVTYKPYFFSI